MTDHIADLVDWQLSNPPTPAPVTTTCYVCGTTWAAEVAQCPQGCEWDANLGSCATCDGGGCRDCIG